jgi:hypothetical protein
MTQVQDTRARKHLIGPELYPLYQTVLKLALAAVVGSAVLAGLIKAVLSGDGADPIARGLLMAWNGAFVAIGAVTVVFTLLQTNAAARERVLEAWRPLTGFDVFKIRRRTGFDRVGAIAAQSLFVLWWTGAFQLSQLMPWMAGEGARLSPVWHALFWPVLALSIAVIAVNAMSLTGLLGRRLDHALHVVLHLALLAVALAALRGGIWVDVADPSSSLARNLNIGVAAGLISLAGLAVVLSVSHAWMMLRRDPR